MNDNELATMVRDSVTGVHAATPVNQIVSRGRAVRARRRIPGVAAVMAGAAGVVLAVTMLATPSHPASQPTAHLAAWTVAKQSNGDIHVNIHQLRDPAGLQATLRADGLPVNVSFTGPPLSASCQPYPATKDLLSSVGHFQRGNGSFALVIHPAALPGGVGISIFDHPEVPAVPQAKGRFPLAFGLVQASQQCTGS
jgi:hypothetical protein